MMRRNRPFYDGLNEIAVGMRLLKDGNRAAECRVFQIDLVAGRDDDRDFTLRQNLNEGAGVSIYQVRSTIAASKGMPSSRVLSAAAIELAILTIAAPASRRQDSTLKAISASSSIMSTDFPAQGRTMLVSEPERSLIRCSRRHGTRLPRHNGH